MVGLVIHAIRYASSPRTDGDLALADCLAEIGQPPIHETSSTADNGGNKYKQMFRLRSLHLLAFFALLYVGVEVTLGGTLLRPFGTGAHSSHLVQAGLSSISRGSVEEAPMRGTSPLASSEVHVCILDDRVSY